MAVGTSTASAWRSGGFAVTWSKLALKLKNLRSVACLTTGFTLISTGLGMRFGLWLGLLIAGFCAIAYEWHLSRPD